MSEVKVLILDDEVEMLENLDRLLTSEGYACRTLSDSTRFREVRDEVQPDVLITDLRMPGADGMTVLAAAGADDPDLPVILITGFASVSTAVEAIQEGAFDYLAKPFTSEQLFIAVERAARQRYLVRENQELKERIRTGSLTTGVIGVSEAFTAVLDKIERVASTDANVLVTGESGTGKEVIVRLLHDRSTRADRPFVPVDCAALPEGLLESELFGHEKGAFTGAVARRKGLLLEANGGTLFLDEIGDMTLPLQAKLLRVLEQRQIRPLGDSRLIDLDVRVVAATNVDIQAAVAEGAFREDLYYRLNVVHVRMPPLRERVDDLPLLAGHFLQEAALAAGRPVPRVSKEAWRALGAYPWPGNIRELRNVMHRVVALDDDGRIRVSDLTSEVRSGRATIARDSGSGDLPLVYEEAKDRAMRAFMATYLDRLLDAHGGNVSRAAEAAGVSRRTLHRWLADERGSVEEEPDEG